MPSSHVFTQVQQNAFLKSGPWKMEGITSGGEMVQMSTWKQNMPLYFKILISWLIVCTYIINLTSIMVRHQNYLYSLYTHTHCSLIDLSLKLNLLYIAYLKLLFPLLNLFYFLTSHFQVLSLHSKTFFIYYFCFQEQRKNVSHLV